MLFSFFFEVEFLATVTAFKLLASLFHFDHLLIIGLTSQPGQGYLIVGYALPRISRQSSISASTLPLIVWLQLTAYTPSHMRIVGV